MQTRHKILGLTAAALFLGVLAGMTPMNPDPVARSRWREHATGTGNEGPLVIASARGTRGAASAPLDAAAVLQRTVYIRSPAP